MENVGDDKSIQSSNQKWESLNHMKISDFTFQRKDTLCCISRRGELKCFHSHRNAWTEDSAPDTSEEDWLLDGFEHADCTFALDQEQDTIWRYAFWWDDNFIFRHSLSKYQIGFAPPNAEYRLQTTEQVVPMNPEFRMDDFRMLVVGDMVHIVARVPMDSIHVHIVMNKHNLEIDPRSSTLDSMRNYFLDNFICVNDTLYLFGTNGNENALFAYSLANKEWNKIEARNQNSETLGMIFSGSCAVAMSASLRERYILIFRGFKPKHRVGTDRIVVYDVHQNIFKKCSIKLPSFAKDPYKWNNAVIVRHRNKEHLATIGFISRLYKTEEFSDVERVPDVVMKLMCQWISIEYVHIVQWKGGHSVQHFQISVDDIMESIVSDE